MLDLYFFITYFSANYAYILSEAKKMAKSVAYLSETSFPKYIMDVSTVIRDITTRNASLELE